MSKKGPSILSPPKNSVKESLQSEKEARTSSKVTVDDNIYTLHIHVGEMKGFRAVYPQASVSLKVEFSNEILMQSDPQDVEDILNFGQDTELRLNLEDSNLIDKFLSNPIIFTLSETERLHDLSMSNVIAFGSAGKAQWRSEESVLELEEALLGQRSTLHTTGSEDTTTKKNLGKKSGSKSSKGSRTKKGSKSSKSSKGKEKKKKNNKNQAEISPNKPKGEQMAGIASLDLIPLFLANQSIEETLILKAGAGQPLDDRMKSAARLPRLQVSVTLDKPIPLGNVFNLTVESVYNPPKIFSEKMDYLITFGLPCIKQQPNVIFSNCKYSRAPREKFQYKKYYGTDSPSSYLLSDNYDNVKSNFENDIEDIVNSLPRIDYNTLKRQFATDDNMDELRSQIRRYRNIGLEFYMVNPDVMTKTPKLSIGGNSKKDKDSKKGKDKSSKTSKGGKKKGKDADSTTTKASEKKDEEYLHLMGMIDVCRLLYPGQKLARVACQLRTFNMQEFEDNTGLNDSYFRPKPPPPPPLEIKEEKPKKEKSKGKKEKSKSSKSSKSTKTKSSKGAKKGNKGGAGNLTSKLPSPPAMIPLSEPVYNEDGLPTFIIVELEFRDALVPKRDLEEMAEDLEELVKTFPQGPQVPCNYKSKSVTDEFYCNTIRSTIKDIKHEYLQYLAAQGEKENLQGFMKYLKKQGNFQNYMASITKACAQYCNVSKEYDANLDRVKYQSFISESYVNLVDMMNTILSEVFSAGVEVADNLRTIPGDDLLHYALEATEIGAFALANRYYLQRICSDEGNSKYWFDYALFKMHTENLEAAQECVQEALRREIQHPDSLVLFACLIARKRKLSEAETCLLNVTLNNPSWLEGWLALYCIYERRKNFEGMEICMEFAQKNLPSHCPRKEDLAWATDFLPNTVNYIGAAYFISLGLYDEAEMLLANEIIKKQDDNNEFVLGVIDYYKGHFDHGMTHIDNSCSLGSCIPQKCSLKGHYYAQQNMPDCALMEYSKVLENRDLQEDPYVYLVYVRAGLCYSGLGDHQKARQCLLKASQMKGTPYSWLCCGILYYFQKDFLSAEECLTVANTLDNVMPETWAYLTLVNIELKRADEASSCYQKMLDNKLENQELRDKVAKKFKVFQYDPTRASVLSNV